jgi:hypothetical protein
MSEARPMQPEAGGRASSWVTAVLGFTAAVTVGYWTTRALGEADTEPMESPLMLSVARQLITGPRELYGPFDGRNPLVLIHAPLYYRAAALTAWSMTRAGLKPVDAARLGGRAVSILGLAATMGAAYRLGRLGGLPRRAGWWAALLVAAAPALAGQPYAVRPDMAGVALQTWGAALALEALEGPGRRLVLASALFGLAACVKQHLLAAWAVSVGLLVWGWLRGRLGPGAMARVVIPGAAVAALVYGGEWLVTGGRVWDAAFLAASHVGRVHPGDRNHVFIVCLGLGERSVGQISLLAAALLTAGAALPGLGRKALAWVGTVAIGLVLASSLAELRADTPEAGVRTILAAVLGALIALPTGLSFARSVFPGGRVDAALWVYLLAELALALLLLRGSSGTWINYAIPTIVFGSALLGRALARAVDTPALGRVPVPIVLASLVLVFSSLNALRDAGRVRDYEPAIARGIFAHLGRPRSSYFFTDRPGLNRLNGRLELVYDDWLYPVFESLGLAESRSGWLSRALVEGRVLVVIATTERPLIEGTTIDLSRLGYRREVHSPPFFVWTR